MDVNPSSYSPSMRKTWEMKFTSEAERFMNMDIIIQKDPWLLRFFANLWNMFNLHLFHCMVLVVITMFAAIVLHLRVMKSSRVKDLFIKDEKDQYKYSLIVRNEEQMRLIRMERKLWGTYATLFFFVLMMFVGFAAWMIVDVSTLTYYTNVYEAHFIIWRINAILRNTLYYTHFSFSMLETMAVLYLSLYILINFFKTHKTTYRKFNWNFKVLAFLLISSTLIHAVYVFPTSKDRYGMMEVSRQGEKLGYEFVDMFGEALSIFTALYFVWFLRFHIIYPELDSFNKVFVSIFWELQDHNMPNSYWAGLRYGDDSSDEDDDSNLKTTNSRRQNLEETKFLYSSMKSDCSDPNPDEFQREFLELRQRALASRMTGLTNANNN